MCLDVLVHAPILARGASAGPTCGLLTLRATAIVLALGFVAIGLALVPIEALFAWSSSETRAIDGIATIGVRGDDRLLLLRVHRRAARAPGEFHRFPIRPPLHTGHVR